jgi:hypothetical protein
MQIFGIRLYLILSLRTHFQDQMKANKTAKVDELENIARPNDVGMVKTFAYIHTNIFTNVNVL